MKRIIIKDLGPIKEADIILKKINIIIGEQSIGKSCVLKVASYCSWVEKRIAIDQTAKRFERKEAFLRELVKFHRLEGYVHESTAISYESDYIIFSYDTNSGFYYQWKENRWEYKRPKVCYIPAERNMVAVIPNWFEVKSLANNIQSFMADWSEARKNMENDSSILNLEVAYHYDDNDDSDIIMLPGGCTLPFSNVSSGLQSLIPMYVLISYITSEKSWREEGSSVKHKEEREKLTSALLNYYDENIGSKSIKLPHAKGEQDLVKLEYEYVPNPEKTIWVMNHFSNIAQTHYCNIFLEEPEENLFPSTQQLFMRSLLKHISIEKNNAIFLSTHSPYILDALLENERFDLGLFYIQSVCDGSVVKTATEEDIQDMYDDGVDAFFNIERLGNGEA